MFGDRVLLSVQNPIVLDPHAEPQPDLVLLRPRAGDYEDALPTGIDTYLVVEVSDTTFDYDTMRKVPAYARGGIRAVWVVALARTPSRDRVHVFEDLVGRHLRLAARGAPRRDAADPWLG